MSVRKTHGVCCTMCGDDTRLSVGHMVTTHLVSGGYSHCMDPLSTKAYDAMRCGTCGNSSSVELARHAASKQILAQLADAETPSAPLPLFTHDVLREMSEAHKAFLEKAEAFLTEHGLKNLPVPDRQELPPPTVAKPQRTKFGTK